MRDVTRILDRVQQGDPTAANELLPLVYEELRRLAAWRLAQEQPGQTLQATALVHEAYLKLVDQNGVPFLSEQQTNPNFQFTSGLQGNLSLVHFLDHG